MFVKSQFNTQYKATIGADFMTKELVIDGELVTLQIWDTAGQERFLSLGVSFYKGSECCALVYDITNPKSFESITKWKDEFILQAGPKDPSSFPFVLIGNKIDKESERKVNSSKAMQWCKQNNEMPFFEASAKDATNVKSIFERMARDGLKSMKSGDVINPFKNEPNIKLDPISVDASHSAQSGCKC
jgi:Ras-related protein Rab-7A